MTVDCTDVLEHLWEFLDAELGTEDIASIMRHVGTCQMCRESSAHHRAYLELLRRQRACIASARLLWQVRVAVRASAL